MPAPLNPLKERLAAGETTFGCWLALSSLAAAEIAAGAGFDWCVIDAEHGPNGLAEVLAHLRAMHGRPAEPVVRVPAGEEWLLKQVLDAGARSLVVPMVHDAAEAAAIARAVRYPPEGTRGIGAPIVRASGYDAIPDYLATANGCILLVVQIESREAVANVDAIAATPGVDALFVGPADLAADMGHPGNPAAAEVQGAIDHVIARAAAHGKASGMLAFDLEAAARHARMGVGMVAVTSDVTALAQSLRATARAARERFAK
ncbi:4-hydroxy-2-oxoheptanedioate aldolase [Meinhardsimonia xiamenensis]|jgi:4-hydroxy-2-oxoheptanedioate aldolase|uniref:Hydroxypyruvate/pyruvate aldolase n=1 Tax=Meinhardsimonia xiamenensis TaxID=990712 RepID=A0A1G9FLM5_9RHOB|nr:aldolase/citrate lyase family protein [Meinhardsimonia xiamenensis]PRX37783.1 4-hydroxy-2-oxoheptanedioate aldolase [Meinhardsimonia xiamenensis]SDK89269.1 4-hydroxy-2-oxoheptanedioate aldolase [Meinhardsimonia xiamenensis]